MKGLIKKELYTSRLAIFFYFLSSVCAIAVSFDKVCFIFLSWCFILPCIFVGKSIINDSVNGWNVFEKTLPVSKKQGVDAKFTMTLVFLVISAFFTILALFVNSLWAEDPMFTIPEYATRQFIFLMILALSWASLMNIVIYILPIRREIPLVLSMVWVPVVMIFISENINLPFEITNLVLAISAIAMVSLFATSWIVCRKIY